MNRQTLRHYWPALAILATIVASSALFASFASELLEGELASVDKIGVRLAASARSPVADFLFNAATQLGSAPFLIMATLGVAFLLRRRYTGKLILPVVLSPLVATILVQALKSIFSRARPSEIAFAGFSFPSGHTTNATAVAFTLTYILVREHMLTKIHWIWAVTLALLVGASRVYLGAHWASDVLGGWIVGSGVAIACCLLYERALLARRDG